MDWETLQYVKGLAKKYRVKAYPTGYTHSRIGPYQIIEGNGPAGGEWFVKRGAKWFGPYESLNQAKQEAQEADDSGEDPIDRMN